MLLINFKTYPQAGGLKALQLTRVLSEAAKDYPRVAIGFAPPALELAEVARHGDSPIWAQHLDPVSSGQRTGFLSPADAKAAGAVGTFLNHSEHPLDPKTIQRTLELAVNEELKVLLFAGDPRKVAQLSRLSPDFIAYEPPELIGGKISVTSAKAETIKKAVEAAGRIPLLIGAGVHERLDITATLSLGAIGAVVSSAVVTAPDPKKIFAGLLSGFGT